MSMKRRATKIAPTLIGKHEDAAFNNVLRAGCAVQFIVADGHRCGRNSNVRNDVVCLFANEQGIVEHAVVGSRGIYAHPAYLAARPREEQPA